MVYASIRVIVICSFTSTVYIKLISTVPTLFNSAGPEILVSRLDGVVLTPSSKILLVSLCLAEMYCWLITHGGNALLCLQI